MRPMPDLEVGQWVTLMTPAGREIRGKVTSIERDEHHGITNYTLMQFPELAAEGVTRYWDADWNEIT